MILIIVAIGVAICAICMVIMVIRDLIVGRAVLTRLNSLAEGHQEGFEIMTAELDRMNARVSALEGRHLNVVRKVDQ
jgi:hypothetical protein